MRISAAEKAAYDDDMVALFQQNGWQDGPTQMIWAEKAVVPYMRRRRADWCRETGLQIEMAPHGLMIQDNLSSQCREEFVDYIEKEASTVVHFGEKSSSTHMWAAIDRGIGKIIKGLTTDEVYTWCAATRELG